MPGVTVGVTRYLTVKEAADLLEVTQDHVRGLARVGTLTRNHETGRVLVSEASVLSYKSSRGPWRPAGVVGGAQAAKRLNVCLPFGGRKAGSDAA